LICNFKKNLWRYAQYNLTNLFLYYVRDMLKLGSSKPWFDAMELLTGQREMDAGPLLNYFRPLYEWLQHENKRTGEYLGWETNKKSNYHSHHNMIYYIHRCQLDLYKIYF